MPECMYVVQFLHKFMSMNLPAPMCICILYVCVHIHVQMCSYKLANSRVTTVPKADEGVCPPVNEFTRGVCYNPLVQIDKTRTPKCQLSMLAPRV